MDRRILDLYDDFAGGGLDRRGFLKQLAVLAGGTAAACALLPLLEIRDAQGGRQAPCRDRDP
jgi:carboxymethylenebutenolidase